MKIRPLYLLNVILTIVLLTSLLANATVNRSGTAATKEYDPFKDMNEDGKINILDLVIEAGYFGTSGDPTKNVNVTNWPSTYFTNVINWPSQQSVNVTNWPEDRPLTIKKGTEKIVVLNTFEGDWGGYCAGLNVFLSEFYYLFEPKGHLSNVDGIYVNVVWRANVVAAYNFSLRFYKGTEGLYYDNVTYHTSIFDKSEAQCFSVSYYNPDFDYSKAIDQGLNRLRVGIAEPFKVFIFKIELFVEYYYYG